MHWFPSPPLPSLPLPSPSPFPLLPPPLPFPPLPLPSPPLPSPPLPNRTEIEHFRSQCATVLEEYGREFGVKKNEPAV